MSLTQIQHSNQNSTIMTLILCNLCMSTYTSPLVTVVYTEELAIEWYIHANIEIFPMPAVAHIIFGETMSLDQLSLRNATGQRWGEEGKHKLPIIWTIQMSGESVFRNSSNIGWMKIRFGTLPTVHCNTGFKCLLTEVPLCMQIMGLLHIPKKD